MFLYAVGFVSGAAVPRTIDSGGPRSNTATAVVIDVLLLALFAVWHTAMARPAFKRRALAEAGRGDVLAVGKVKGAWRAALPAPS